MRLNFQLLPALYFHQVLFPLKIRKKIKEEDISLLKKMIIKLQERSPLKYLVPRCAASLSPAIMALHQEEPVVKFEKLVDSMYKKQRLSYKEADLAKSQYEMFFEKDVSQ